MNKHKITANDLSFLLNGLFDKIPAQEIYELLHTLRSLNLLKDRIDFEDASEGGTDATH